MLYLFSDLDLHTRLLLLLALISLLFYEAINGFHDTANAVATVIYTRAMRSKLAVFMAAVFNFFGVLFGGLSVACAIVHMLPTDILLNISSSHGLTMIFSILLSAIIWNLSTWYFGIPSSSSHTLIGAIIGIGLTNALITDAPLIEALNLPKVVNIFISLIISPIIGLAIAGGLIFILRSYWNRVRKHTNIYLIPIKHKKKNINYKKKDKDNKEKPPFWTRIALIISAIGVAFSHGANDGQKGIGLVMLVLIGVAPAGFVVNMNASSYEITRTHDAINNVETYFRQHSDLLKKVTGVDQLMPLLETKISKTDPIVCCCHPANVINALENARNTLSNIKNYNKLTVEQRGQTRRAMLCISEVTNKVAKLPEVKSNDKILLKRLRSDMLNTIEYVPTWVTIAIALALGTGTMIGWRRITTTLGEKIGKKSMTYIQGISAQMTAAISIGLASYTGMPVSTTHVLSASVVGVMIVDGGGIQRKTVVNILTAWILTLPASIVLSGGLYWIALKLI